MFTGIIRWLGAVESATAEGTNRHFVLRTSFDEPIRVDQSIAHEGVCLTVTEVLEQTPAFARYRVTAVEETLRKTTLGTWQAGKKLNVEACLKVGDRLDGHFVQGHVDTTGTVSRLEVRDGSWLVEISFPEEYARLLVNRGSICINGVSLTVVEAGRNTFTVTIIPFTWEHTTFHTLAEGRPVNLEFDILGKYFVRGQELEV